MPEGKKQLNKEEKFVCEITWGGVPLDTAFVRESKLFQANFKEFKSGKWSELYKSEINNQKSITMGSFQHSEEQRLSSAAKDTIESQKEEKRNFFQRIVDFFTGLFS